MKNSNKNYKSRQLAKQNQELKVIVLNKPTKEQAKEKIRTISEKISYMFSNNEMEVTK